MSQRVERRIVTASQIQSLPQFEAYIAFAYESPTAFVRFEPFPIEKIAEPFVRYLGRGFAKDELEVLGTRSEGDDRDPVEVAAEQAAQAPSYDEEFEQYRKGLIEGGLEFYADDSYLDALHAHFQIGRGKKISIREIGAPPLSGHMMQGAHEAPMMRNHISTQKRQKANGTDPKVVVEHDEDGVVIEAASVPASSGKRKRPRRVAKPPKEKNPSDGSKSIRARRLAAEAAKLNQMREPI